ncbi:MAG: hypothetical protein IJ968_07070, partial [Clostridia bacterium]|nr:hypothetical protein [Clostridia bacterium]
DVTKQYTSLRSHQRLQKKIIIARVRLVFIHLICRMLNYCVLLLLRRLRMFSEQNKLEKTSRLARPKSFANAKAKTRDSMRFIKAGGRTTPHGKNIIITISYVK